MRELALTLNRVKIHRELDTSYLKNPPKGYQEAAIDLWARFDGILDSIKVGNYSNEYEFQVDLYNTFNAAHDGHFRFAPDLLSKAVAFRRPIQLVSVSRDGTELPKIYIRGKMRLRKYLYQDHNR